MQIVIPLVMTISLFGAFGGDAMVLKKTVAGSSARSQPVRRPGSRTPGLPGCLLAGAAVDRLLVGHEQPEDGVTQYREPDHRIRQDHLSLHWRLCRRSRFSTLPAEAHGSRSAQHVGGDPADIIAALLIMKLAAFGTMKENIAKQFAIFRDKTHLVDDRVVHRHLRPSSVSMALPLSITGDFGISHVPDAAGVMQHTLKNPNAPSAFTYA